MVENMSDQYKEVKITHPITAFGEIAVAERQPVVQIDAVYGLRSATDTQSIAAAGSGGVDVINSGTGREFRCQSGTDSAGSGKLISNRAVRYRSGQGAIYRFTARFDEGIAGNTQRAGAMNLGNELSFGYNGTSFSILHKRGGSPEIQTLTITVGAAGAETATVTLDGTAFPVSVTAGDTKHAAFELAEESYAGWNVFHNDSDVVFISKTTGDKTGSFSFSSDGTTDGAIVETAAGVTEIDTWIPQEEWNVDKMLDGTAGPSIFSLDPQKINVFEIKQQYLGGGPLFFFIENPNTGQFRLVHTIEYANRNETPSLLQPIFQVGWISENAGNTSNVSIFGSSAGGFIEGPITPFRNPDGHSAVKTGITTTLTAVFSIRVSTLFADKINLTEVQPLRVDCAVDGTKSALIQVLRNAQLGGEPDWQYHSVGNQVVEIDAAATTAARNVDDTGEIAIAAVSKVGSVTIDMSQLGIRLCPGDTLTVAVVATSASTTDATAAITWLED